MPDRLPFNILSDVGTANLWLAKLDAARVDNQTLDEVVRLIETRYVPTAMGDYLPLHDGAVTVEQAALLYYLTVTVQPILSIETGFTFGLMASVITLAHMQNGLYGGHVPIQENANHVFDGVGAYTMKRLDLSGYQVMEHPTEIVLPQIYTQGLNKGLLLVYFNSAEEADEQMMEFFFLHRMLNDGGVMAINMSHPARQKLLTFIKTEYPTYAVVELPCGIALVQKPNIRGIARVKATRH